MTVNNNDLYYWCYIFSIIFSYFHILIFSLLFLLHKAQSDFAELPTIMNRSLS